MQKSLDFGPESAAGLITGGLFLGAVD